MKLKKLLKDIKVLHASRSAMSQEIAGIATNHKKVKEGDVFIALSGENFDGNEFVEEAICNGATAVITEKSFAFSQCVRVDDARHAFALISKHFYGDACDKLKIVAVTGTNGKTTTCNTIADILRTSGKNVGVVGTMGAKMGDEIVETGMTTPDPDKLHKLFFDMVEEGVEYVVMEASAHALALKKLDGIRFEVGVLTNITEDHLDFFGDMETYARAKFQLFDKNRVKKAIICYEKAFNKRWVDKLQVPVLTYGIDDDSMSITATVVHKSLNGSCFVGKYDGHKRIYSTSLVGMYNVENLLASIGVCSVMGLSNDDIHKGVNCTLPVEGRFNVIDINGKNVIIDFAHTPDGLENVLSTTKDLTENKVVVIFGCGGNRDKLKRPIMGEIASSMADEVILTSDNPRYEKAKDIINEIKKGVVSDNVISIEDRKKAIEFALAKYPEGTTIVIAGKGGEKYQDIEGVKIPYNDFDVVNHFFHRQLFEGKEIVETEKECDVYDEIEKE